ncbi:MAG: hypothetical protein DMF68_21080, partial [Acidobacteria bacterium]
YNGATTDGSAWESGGGQDRVLRGGSWGVDAVYSRSAGRGGNSAGFRSSVIGFRVAASLRSS